MINIRINNTKPESFSQSKSGTIWGPIYFETEQGAFPDKGWTDMVAAFLGPWIEALCQFASGSTKQATVHFLDGPFSLKLGGAGSGIVEVSFVGDEKREPEKSTVRELLQNAVSAGDLVLAICKERGWSTRDRDTESLIGGIERAKRLLAGVR